MNNLIDLKDDYNRHLRRRRHLKMAAWWLRSLAAMVLLMGFGALLALVDNAAFGVIASAFVLAGVWGEHHLSTRH